MRNQRTEDFSALPYLYALLNCLICAWYGTPFMSDDNVLVTTVNMVGAVFQLAYVILYIVYAEKSKKVVYPETQMHLYCLYSSSSLDCFWLFLLVYIFYPLMLLISIFVVSVEHVRVADRNFWGICNHFICELIFTRPTNTPRPRWIFDLRFANINVCFPIVYNRKLVSAQITFFCFKFLNHAILPYIQIQSC